MHRNMPRNNVALILSLMCIGLLALVSAGPTPAAAEDVFSWKDADGRLVFGNNPPNQSAEKKKVKAELSRYSNKQVFDRYGLTARAALSQEEEEAVQAEPKFPATGKTKLSHSEIDLDYDDQNRITICSVEVTNDGDKAGTDIVVSFEFDDGSMIAADGPATLAAGASSVYSIPESQLPVAIEQKQQTTPEGEETSLTEPTKPTPKVVIQLG